MRSIIPAGLLLAAVLGAGCAATVASDGYGPDLVTVSPGVQVIADYDEPIFYSDGYYWRQYGGGWYRSSYYTGGWVYARPPVAVLRIDRPTAYVCRGYACDKPVTDPDALAEQLENASRAGATAAA